MLTPNVHLLRNKHTLFLFEAKVQGVIQISQTCVLLARVENMYLINKPDGAHLLLDSILSQAGSPFERLKVQCLSILSDPKATSDSFILHDVSGNYGIGTKDAQVWSQQKGS